MRCIYFSKCGSCTLHNLTYKEQLELKSERIKESFKEFINDFDLFASKESSFRDRAEFRIIHSKNSISYAMYEITGSKKLLSIKECKIVNPMIDGAMKALKIEIEKNPILKERLFSVEFLSTSKKDLLTTLIYHKKIGKEWEDEAKRLSEKLDMKIVGRSRKVKIVIDKDYVEEELKIGDKKYKYRYLENSFTQPNSYINTQMISWAKEHSRDLKGDLLELYCGHGNFTIPLSENFDKVLATEISKTSIKSAIFNKELNKAHNISFVRLSSEELSRALEGEREFRRLKDIDLNSYNFSTVFVDPPRAGLDDKTRDFIKKFNNIIYISCNPQTLKRDLLDLHKHFKIERFAIFDQFPYTEHIECGVLLKK